MSYSPLSWAPMQHLYCIHKLSADQSSVFTPVSPFYRLAKLRQRVGIKIVHGEENSSVGLIPEGSEFLVGGLEMGSPTQIICINNIY